MSLEEIKESSLDLASELNPADGQELQTNDKDAKPESPAEFIEMQHSENKTEVKAEDTYTGEIDQELYKEVLEKLDITHREKDLQEKLLPEKKVEEVKVDENTLVKVQIEKAIAGDFAKIQQLMQAGLINSAQGQNLKKQVLKKAFDKLVQTEKIRRNLSHEVTQNQSTPQPINNSMGKNEFFDEFSKSNPDFFTQDGRKEVLDYLKSDNVIVGKDDLSKISGIIRTVEKAAIDRYLKKVAHEKTLRDSNEAAKQRLTANAQKSSSSGNLLRTFTREQIGKMSSAEFAKYESSIMEQLKKGQIR